MSIPLGNRVVAFARAVSAVGGDRSNVLIGRNLLQQLRQHGRITDVAGGDLDRPNLQCFVSGASSSGLIPLLTHNSVPYIGA